MVDAKTVNNSKKVQHFCSFRDYVRTRAKISRRSAFFVLAKHFTAAVHESDRGYKKFQVKQDSAFEACAR
jgi:hypothetical protein